MYRAKALVATLLGMFTASPCLAFDDDARTPIVEGLVVDGEGKPVPNATVRLLDGARAESSARTDETGTARVSRPIAADLTTIPVIASDAEGANQAYVEWLFRDPDDGQKPLRLELTPAAEVVVQVTDTTGAPVGDALIAALTFAADVLAHGRTNADSTLR